MCIYETSMWPVTIRQGNWWYWAITSWSRNVSGTVYYHAMVSLFHTKMWRKKTSKKLSKWNLVYFGYFPFWGGGRRWVKSVWNKGMISNFATGSLSSLFYHIVIKFDIKIVWNMKIGCGSRGPPLCLHLPTTTIGIISTLQNFRTKNNILHIC